MKWSLFFAALVNIAAAQFVGQPTLAAIQSQYTALPSCGKTCFDNFAHATGALGYGCAGSSDCLCNIPEFGFGARDCLIGACQSSINIAAAHSYITSWCAAPGGIDATKAFSALIALTATDNPFSTAPSATITPPGADASISSEAPPLSAATPSTITVTSTVTILPTGCNPDTRRRMERWAPKKANFSTTLQKSATDPELTPAYAENTLEMREEENLRLV